MPGGNGNHTAGQPNHVHRRCALPFRPVAELSRAVNPSALETTICCQSADVPESYRDGRHPFSESYHICGCAPTIWDVAQHCPTFDAAPHRYNAGMLVSSCHSSYPAGEPKNVHGRGLEGGEPTTHPGIPPEFDSARRSQCTYAVVGRRGHGHTAAQTDHVHRYRLVYSRPVA